MTGDPTIGRRTSPNRLYRDTRRGKVAGVCAGIAGYFGINVTFVRCCALLSLFIFTLPTFITYVGAALLLDPLPDDLYASNEEAEFWRDVRVAPRGTIHDIRHKFRDIEQRLRGMETYVTSPEFKLDKEIRDL